jgi:hypothetical protein
LSGPAAHKAASNTARADSNEAEPPSNGGASNEARSSIAAHRSVAVVRPENASTQPAKAMRGGWAAMVESPSIDSQR